MHAWARLGVEKRGMFLLVLFYLRGSSVEENLASHCCGV